MQKFHRYTQVLLATLLSLGLVGILVGVASAQPAHAKVTKAIPDIASTITQAPTKVTVFALENINPDPKLSNLFVYSPSGDLISQGNAAVPISSPKEMSISIKPTGNGVYVVRWITVSALDGDPDQGAFVFTVKPVSAAATPTATSQGTTTTAPTNSGSSGIPLWVPILVGILALIIGGGIGLAIGRGAARPAGLSSMRQKVAEQQREETPTRRP